MGRLRDFLIAEATVVSVILVNAAAIFLSTTVPEGSFRAQILERVDIACVAYFVMEAVLKIQCSGWRAYIRAGWNRFDFLIVILSLPVLIEPFVDFQGFGIVLVLRLGRLFRLFRVMRFIPHIDHLTVGIGRALKASIGVLIAILIVNLIFALGGTLLFGEFAPAHFGNPLMSMYSTFKVFTVEGWYEIPDLIAESTDSDLMALWVRVYYVVAVVVGGLLGLSLANAIFIDEMTADNTRPLEDKIDALARELKALRAIIERPSGPGSGWVRPPPEGEDPSERDSGKNPETSNDPPR
jgi:voltage-gated sodium channel